MSFNLNSINKKIVLYLTLIGFILSFISGLISGNSFGELFIRSFISGVVIGIVIIIVNIVIVIYLPELLETEETEDVDDEDGDSRIDIVMPEEKYQVQAGDSNGSDDDLTDSATEQTNSSFKEVDLDNLKSLSSSNDNYTNNVENYSDDSESFSQTSSANDSSEFGNHSAEELAKAVKTVLKKE